jgi:hypothetical protein
LKYAGILKQRGVVKIVTDVWKDLCGKFSEDLNLQKSHKESLMYLCVFIPQVIYSQNQSNFIIVIIAVGLVLLEEIKKLSPLLGFQGTASVV